MHAAAKRLLTCSHLVCPTCQAQMHFPPSTAVLDEVNTTEAWRDLRSVLTSHDNVRLVLSGHFHKASWGRFGGLE